MNELIGLGVIIGAIPLAYLFWQIARLYKSIADEAEMETAYIIAATKKSAKKHDIDLDKEMARTNVFKDIARKRSFRSEMRKEIMDDLFGKEKEEE